MGVVTRRHRRDHARHMPDARLVTIRFSHYCEKARWALDRARVPYVEEPHPPMLSWRSTFGAGGKRTAPVFVTKEGRVLAESTEILEYADHHGSAAPLFPDASTELGQDVRALEDRFDRELGTHARRYAYDFVLRGDDDTVASLLSAGASPREARIARTLRPLLVFGIRRGLKVDAAGVARSKAKLEQLFGEMEARLADGRSHLAGDAFTAADLTFASLAAPLAYPEPYARTAIPFERLGADARAMIEEFRRRPAGQFVLRMYESR